MKTKERAAKARGMVEAGRRLPAVMRAMNATAAEVWRLLAISTRRASR